MEKPGFHSHPGKYGWNVFRLFLAKNRNLSGLRIYFDYGTDDRHIAMTHLDEGSKALARIPHTFKIHPGEPHEWALIASHIEETLPFLCQTFR